MSKLVYFTAATTFSGMVYGSYKAKRENTNVYRSVIENGYFGLVWPLTTAYSTSVKLGEYIEENYSDIIEEKIR